VVAGHSKPGGSATILLTQVETAQPLQKLGADPGNYKSDTIRTELWTKTRAGSLSKTLLEILMQSLTNNFIN
jgi:hypothetical protein